MPTPWPRWTACGATPPDLLLTDYKMPGLDGLALIRRVRALPGGLQIPALLVTAAEDPALHREALEAGAAEVLTKPFDHEHARTRCLALLATARAAPRTRLRATPHKTIPAGTISSTWAGAPA
ncbi:MAG: response regulator [Gammaproteobacteria bacterium]|nr:response regulator [Gammaproteobacteria bacterium]NIR97606.1 response regulator [Gammaproteobacteria bacterium]NIT63256.1 response regulator [Gammaproteobacteria bacterium]NIV20188.1 response regulator [Gammaproteobacteria bacterium]NIY31836.1 response regulator [Gammaproteobacteria bacterium]